MAIQVHKELIINFLRASPERREATLLHFGDSWQQADREGYLQRAQDVLYKLAQHRYISQSMKRSTATSLVELVTIVEHTKAGVKPVPPERLIATLKQLVSYPVTQETVCFLDHELLVVCVEILPRSGIVVPSSLLAEIVREVNEQSVRLKKPIYRQRCSHGRYGLLLGNPDYSSPCSSRCLTETRRAPHRARLAFCFSGGKTMAPRRTKKDESFAFTFEEKKYVIQRAYQAQPATLVLSDGKILQVRVWQLLPVEPQPYHVETFDPATVSAAELAQEKDGFLAELVVEG